IPGSPPFDDKIPGTTSFDDKIPGTTSFDKIPEKDVKKQGTTGRGHTLQKSLPKGDKLGFKGRQPDKFLSTLSAECVYVTRLGQQTRTWANNAQTPSPRNMAPPRCLVPSGSAPSHVGASF
ncbi:hypothetical protein BaRGS_00021857, partial [Batillaria attramentaria]